ncbi:MlaD family protein [Mycobacterium sp. 1274756.6]|uniref:MlaD family protein n=1 Tax=Mycobacterium sp. 1274756.6 TaxID=1834076 RepID=UPI00336AA2CA
MINSLHLGKTTYRAEFQQVAGVRAGDQINIAGVPVGAVRGTELAGDRVVVTMKIRHGVVLAAGGGRVDDRGHNRFQEVEQGEVEVAGLRAHRGAVTGDAGQPLEHRGQVGAEPGDLLAVVDQGGQQAGFAVQQVVEVGLDPVEDPG